MTPKAHHQHRYHQTVKPNHAAAFLSESLANIESLPAMPVIAQRLLSLSTDSDEGERALINLVEQDAQITARLLSLTNAPSSRFRREVISISDAVIMLGIARVKSVAIAIALMSDFSGLKNCHYFSPHNLYAHSVAMAITMRELSNYMPSMVRPSQEQAYLSGLLHDIGYMAIHYLNHNASEELHHQVVLHPKEPVLLVDLRVIGVTHCDIGERLARQWNLPEEITNVISRHHDPRPELLTAMNCLPTLARLAEVILANFGLHENTSTEIAEHEWRSLSIDVSQRDKIMGDIGEMVVQLSQIPEFATQN